MTAASLPAKNRRWEIKAVPSQDSNGFHNLPAKALCDTVTVFDKSRCTLGMAETERRAYCRSAAAGMTGTTALGPQPSLTGCRTPANCTRVLNLHACRGATSTPLVECQPVPRPNGDWSPGEATEACLVSMHLVSAEFLTGSALPQTGL